MHVWGFGVPGLCRGTGRLQPLRDIDAGRGHASVDAVWMLHARPSQRRFGARPTTLWPSASHRRINRCRSRALLCWTCSSATPARILEAFARGVLSLKGRGVTERGVAALKFLRGCESFQRFSENFRIRFLIQNCQKCAEKC